LLGNNRTSKNVYKKSPSSGKTFIFRHVGLVLKASVMLMILILTSAFFISGYNTIVQWKYLNAKIISVKGLSQLSEEEVIDQSQLRLGKNILSMNLSAAKKRLLMHPLIAEADIVREFPSVVAIRIKEHQPLAIIDLGRTFALNYSGDLFIETSTSDFKQLPVIVGFEPSDIDLDGVIHGQSFTEVMKILRLGLKPDSILSTSTMKQIQVDKQTGLTVNLNGRIKSIQLGYGNYPKKYERLKTLYAFLDKRPDLKNVTSIDLRNVNRIVLKPSRI